MKEISNYDYAMILRLLKSFVNSPCDTIREREDRRQAALLVRKMQKRKKTEN